MPDARRPSKRAPKGLRLSDAVNDLITRVTDLTNQEEFESWMLERVYLMRKQLVEPVCKFLQKRKRAATDADLLRAFFQAAEEYVVCYVNEPDRREARKKKVETLKLQVRRRFLGEDDREAETEKLLDDIRQWQWKTTLDANGRIAFATGSGVAVPGRGDIIHEVGPQVIEQAIKAQRPYADQVRPRDVRGAPGGLVVIRDATRLLVVGDLHGRYDNLEMILRDRQNLKGVIDGDTHLIFTGDAVHPRSSLYNSDEAYEESFCVMLLIMTLKAENPFNVHYIVGNHDNAHAGGDPVQRGKVRQDRAFEESLSKKFKPSVLERYREFVLNCPVAVRASAARGAILFVHALTSGRVLNEQGLINIFTQGRHGKALRDLLWGRDFDAQRIAADAERVAARFVVGGHTVPTPDNAKRYGFEAIGPPAFGAVGDVHLIINAQCDVFGYLDVDLTRRLPTKVTRLLGPDGKGACRVLRAKHARLDDDGK